jgi:hypothetical protein
MGTTRKLDGCRLPRLVGTGTARPHGSSIYCLDRCYCLHPRCRLLYPSRTKRGEPILPFSRQLQECLRQFYVYNLGYRDLYPKLNGGKYPLTQTMIIELGILAAVVLVGCVFHPSDRPDKLGGCRGTVQATRYPATPTQAAARRGRSQSRSRRGRAGCREIQERRLRAERVGRKAWLVFTSYPWNTRGWQRRFDP